MLTWLRAFEATVRLGSFTRAGEELSITQGAVSQQIKRLEESLGFPLLLRRSQGLTLTPEGMKLSPVAETAFSALRGAISDLAAPGGSSPVTLSCSPSFALRWLTPRLGGLARQQPQLDVRIFGEFHKLDRTQMAREGLEAAIRFDTGGYPNMDARKFLDEYLIPIASPAFMRAHPQLRSPKNLTSEMLLHDARPWAGVGDDEEWARWLRGVRVRLKDLHLGKRFNLSQLAVGAALAGEGIAIGRLALVLEDLASGRLVTPFKVAVSSAASYHFISGKDAPRRISLIADWLTREAAVFEKERLPFLKKFRLVEY